jgi:DNA-directed RNA polymerase sigma subunit (sigma70/sigma32)
MVTMKLTPKNMKAVIEETRRKRDEEIRRLYKAYQQDRLTGWTLEKIAERYGLTKQRIQQIVTEGEDEQS